MMPHINGTRKRASKSVAVRDVAVDRDLYSGLMRLYILQHTVEDAVFGLGMIEELADRGYRISAGTLYPILHGLEKKGYLSSEQRRQGKSLRTLYRATPLGRRALAAAKGRIRELFRDVITEGD